MLKLINSNLPDKNKSDYRIIINASIALSTVVIIILGYLSWQSYSDIQKDTSNNYKSESLKDKIIYYREELGSLSDMMVMTGEPEWENRYNQFKPKLNSAINEFYNITTNVYIAEAIPIIDSANINLMSIEQHVFQLVHFGEKETAKTLLLSMQYVNEKKSFVGGIQQITNGLNKIKQMTVEQNRKTMLWQLILICVSLIILIFVWWLAAATLRKYQKEHKRTEEAFKENEETYRTIFENSADGMFLMTDVFQECNQSVCKMFNCNMDDIIGQPPSKFSPEIQPDGKNSLVSSKEKIEAAINGYPQRFYWQHKTKDNILFDADVALNAVTLNGKDYIYAIVRDISETIKLEKVQKALFEISEAAYTATDMISLYKLIHEIISTLMLAKNFYIAIYDEQTGMISFPYMVDEFDPPYPPKKLGKGLTEYILKTGEAKLIDAELDLKLRESGEVEMIGTPTLIWLGVPLKVREKIIGVIVVQDYQNENTYGENEKQLLVFVAKQIAQVIERKKNSEAINAYTEQLKQLNQTKDKFFSIIAHDLKSPFVGLLGLTEMVASGDEELSKANLIEYSSAIHESASTLYGLIENLLEWAQMQRGSMSFDPKILQLHNIVTESIETIKYRAIQKGITIINEIPDTHRTVADEKMIYTILRNLLTNAIKFTRREGKVIIHAKKVNDEMVEVSVCDTGVGISSADIQRLFKIEEKVSSRGTEGEASTGLGLLLCKEFIEKNGGKIWVESEKGKGTTFTFSLRSVI